MLKKSLQLCADIEKTISRIYLNFAQASEATPELKKMWQKMAFDEEDHERQVRFALRLSEEDVYLDTEADEDRKITTLYREVSDIYTQVKRTPLTIQKMLELAQHLEKRFLDVHIANAASCKNEKLKSMLTALGKHDKEHVKQLVPFIKQYCLAPRR